MHALSMTLFVIGVGLMLVLLIIVVFVQSDASIEPKPVKLCCGLLAGAVVAVALDALL